MASRRRKRRAYDDRITLLVFTVLVVVVLFFFDAVHSSRSSYEDSAHHIAEVMTRENGGAVEIDAAAMELLSTSDYSEIKRALDVDSDFSIYVQDGEGNVVPLGQKQCAGSPKAKLDGVPCG